MAAKLNIVMADRGLSSSFKSSISRNITNMSKKRTIDSFFVSDRNIKKQKTEDVIDNKVR